MKFMRRGAYILTAPVSPGTNAYIIDSQYVTTQNYAMHNALRGSNTMHAFRIRVKYNRKLPLETISSKKKGNRLM